MLRGEINSAMISENMPEPLLHIVLLWPITEKIIVLHKNPALQYEKNLTAKPFSSRSCLWFN